MGMIRPPGPAPALRQPDEESHVDRVRRLEQPAQARRAFRCRRARLPVVGDATGARMGILSGDDERLAIVPAALEQPVVIEAFAEEHAVRLFARSGGRGPDRRGHQGGRRHEPHRDRRSSPPESGSWPAWITPVQRTGRGRRRPGRSGDGFTAPRFRRKKDPSPISTTEGRAQGTGIGEATPSPLLFLNKRSHLHTLRGRILNPIGDENPGVAPPGVGESYEGSVSVAGRDIRGRRGRGPGREVSDRCPSSHRARGRPCRWRPWPRHSGAGSPPPGRRRRR